MELEVYSCPLLLWQSSLCMYIHICERCARRVVITFVIYPPPPTGAPYFFFPVATSTKLSLWVRVSLVHNKAKDFSLTFIFIISFYFIFMLSPKKKKKNYFIYLYLIVFCTFFELYYLINYIMWRFWILYYHKIF